MPYCPRCRSEFQDWVQVCPDCGANLAAQLPPISPSGHKKYREELVMIARYTNSGKAHLSQVKLESRGIWSYVVDERQIIKEKSEVTQGTLKLFVEKSNADEALEILESADEELSTESLGMEDAAIIIGPQIEDGSDLLADYGNLEDGDGLPDEESPADEGIIEDELLEETSGEHKSDFESADENAPLCPRCGMPVNHPEGTWRPLVGRKLKCDNCRFVWKP